MILLQKILSYFLIVITIFSLAIASIPSPSIYRANYIEFYDINGNLIDSQINNKHGEYMPLEALNKHTIDAFIAFEDKNFYSHKGFDSLRIFKSVLKNLFSL